MKASPLPCVMIIKNNISPHTEPNTGQGVFATTASNDVLRIRQWVITIPIVTTLTKMMLMVAKTALPSGFIPNIDLTISKACGNDCARKKTQVMFINK